MNSTCTSLNRERFERAAQFITSGGIYRATVEADRQPDGALGTDAALCLSDNCYYGYDVVTPDNICRYLAFWNAKHGEGCVVTTHESEDALIGVVHHAEDVAAIRTEVTATSKGKGSPKRAHRKPRREVANV